MPLSPGDEEFLQACAAAGAPRAEDLPEVRAGLARAEALFGRPIPIGPFLLQQRWAGLEGIAAAQAATRRHILVCPHCWSRVNAFGVPAAGLFSCGGCHKRVAAPIDPLAEVLAVDAAGARFDPTLGARDIPRTLARHGIEQEAEAGFGGTGTVWRALLLPRRTRVSVKVLHGELATDMAAATRFLREGRATAAVRHPNLVPVLHTALERSFPFLILEWVEGEDLQRHVDAHGPLPVERALALAADIARGLAAVHAAGLVHRDVKPSNVLLPPAGGARLTDFGLARAAAGASLQLTRTGDVVGTLNYMAPEQWRDPRRATPASDVYGLGASLVHLLSGRPPFDGIRWSALSDRLLAGETARLEPTPDLPAAVIDLVARLVAVDPAARPQDGAAALRAVAEAGGPQA